MDSTREATSARESADPTRYKFCDYTIAVANDWPVYSLFDESREPELHKYVTRLLEWDAAKAGEAPPDFRDYMGAAEYWNHTNCASRLTTATVARVVTESLASKPARRGEPAFTVEPAHWVQNGDRWEKLRYSPRCASDIKARLDQVWLIDDVLPAGAVAVLDADPNEGKTFTAISMGMSTARGIDWHGRRCEQGRVLYIASEGSLDNRIAAYKKHNAVEEVPDFLVIEATINLHHGTDDRRDLLAAARAFDPKLIIFDTLAAALVGGDENSSEGMGKVLASARELRQATGATILFVHHAGKDKSKGPRGHSSLLGNVDTRMEIDDGVLTIQKQRDGRRGDRYGFELVSVDLGRDPRGKTVTSCVAVPRAITAADDFKRPAGVAGDALTILENLTMGGRRVEVATWREEFGATHYKTAPKSTRSAAFTRAVKSLTASGHVELDKNGDHAWPVPRPEDVRTVRNRSACELCEQADSGSHGSHPPLGVRTCGLPMVEKDFHREARRGARQSRGKVLSENPRPIAGEFDELRAP